MNLSCLASINKDNLRKIAVGMWLEYKGQIQDDSMFPVPESKLPQASSQGKSRDWIRAQADLQIPPTPNLHSGCQGWPHAVTTLATLPGYLKTLEWMDQIH